MELSTLALSSSNMQLYEFYHVTHPETLKKLSVACFDQTAASTAQELVVFVVRQDLYKNFLKPFSNLKKKISEETVLQKDKKNALKTANSITEK